MNQHIPFSEKGSGIITLGRSFIKMHDEWLEMEPRDVTQKARNLLKNRLTEYEKPDIDPQLEKDLIQYVSKRKHST